jgi:hypothetical protein
VGDDGNASGPDRNLNDCLGSARGYGETTDTRPWVADLEDMLRTAWSLMLPEQRDAFCVDPDLLGIAEAVGDAAFQR